MRIAITGATGLLGRNLLFEIIKQNLKSIDSVKIFLLGRRTGDKSLQERIEEILSEDGSFYYGCHDTRSVLGSIRTMEMDLVEEKLRLSQEDYKELKAGKIDFFFHVAALTDFRSTPNVIKSLYYTNVYGTSQILHLVCSLDVKEFCYVGSAYSCGKTYGVIQPDYFNPIQHFRNPYEKTKVEAEQLVREYEKKTGRNCRYFRPSTICGRLIEKPVGAINKFDVFYSWAAWFLRMKKKAMEERGEDGSRAVNLGVRICFSKESGLNIVPADYGAKVIYNVSLRQEPGKSFHVVSREETKHILYIPLMLNKLQITGCRQVDEIPEVQSRLEKFYYKTAGWIFTPYITEKPMLFDVSNIETIEKLCGFYPPPVNKDNFNLLLDYAHEREYGLADKVSLP
ncbi:MAG: SDR family oxidoreductase [Candidatus Omnitrophica bacterium]|nr:SDR family oxidoreductase [Candidatus Omnitrophota bacterium]